MELAPNTFVFGAIAARTKSTTLIVSRENFFLKISILISSLSSQSQQQASQ